MKKIFLFGLLLFAGIISTRAEVSTWLLPTSVTTNMSIDLAENQVMEVLSLSLDPASGIDIVRGEQKVTLGTGGNPQVPYPLFLAGPATVVLKKPSTGGQGSLMTFRVVDAAKVQPISPFAVQK